MSLQETDETLQVSESLNVGKYKLIYVFSHPDIAYHQGHLKVGDTTLKSNKSYKEYSEEELRKALEEAAHERIRSYHGTADVRYRLEHVELAVIENEDGSAVGFRDYEVHGVLLRSGFKKRFASDDKKSGEWFKVSVEEVKAAITAVKLGESTIGDVAVTSSSQIVLRPEQKAAVKQTLRVFKNGSLENPRRMLWNAKMRFGKTLTAYDLVRKMDERENIKRVLIITHRPDVNDSWTQDFRKSGLKDLGWRFGSKRNDSTWDRVSANERFVWFASIQDLRGSYKSDTLTDADFNDLKKNQGLFSTAFDLLIVDEAHEGNTTELAKRMTKALQAPYVLDLSGTPFNLLQARTWEDEDLAARFTYDDQYNWSYPDERKAKQEWEENFPNDPNPYADLPEVKFITYDIKDSVGGLMDTDLGADYSFTELFRTNKVDQKLEMRYKLDGVEHKRYVKPGAFIHEDAVLDLLSKIRGDRKYSDDPKLFPFSGTFKNMFNHTLWMLPSVDACIAMEALMKDERSGFDAYKIVNATGRGFESSDDDTVLEAVKNAIKNAGAIQGKTITLSYRMLTTGVTVPEWTAVFMLNNVTSPMAYMQTAFRAASPGSLQDGRVKDTSYVFDFNPNRCLRQIVETAKWNAKTPEDVKGTELELKAQTELDEIAVKDYLSYISILSLEGSKFVQADEKEIMDRLNEVYVNEVVAKGFDSPLLWNSQELQRFDINRRNILEALRKMQGGSLDKSAGEVKISTFDEASENRLKELARKERDSKKTDPPTSLTPAEVEEKRELSEAKKQELKNRSNAIGVLVGIAARMPMMIFAAPTDERITPSNFAELIDEESWREFMPKNLHRIMPEGIKSLEDDPERLGGDANSHILYWDDVKRFFNDEVFWRACDRIRTIAKEIEEKPVLERKFRKDMLFTTFRNPDKETVLTPARVVTLQYIKTLGGLCYYDLEQSTAKEWFVYTRGIESGELETVEAHRALALLDEGSHELAPIWVSSGVDTDENDEAGFWENREISVYDINSKTALYPLQAAISTWWANRAAHREFTREEALKKGIDFAELTDDELDETLWEEVVENAIFANTRVEYSRKIFQRVLAGFNDELLAKAAKNSTSIDVIKLKKALESWQKLSKKDRPDYWQPLSGSKGKEVYETAGVILRLANKGFLKAHAPEVYAVMNSAVMSSSGAVARHTPAITLNGILGRMMNDWTGPGEEAQRMTDLNSLRKLVEEHREKLPKFEAVVGNPPYQQGNGGNSPAIYQNFVLASQDIARSFSLVYPSRWRNGGWGDGMDVFRENELSSNLYWRYIEVAGKDLFPTSDTGPVNIVLWRSIPREGPIDSLIFGEIYQLKSLRENASVSRPEYSSIALKVKAEKSMSSIVVGQTYYGPNLDGRSQMASFEDPSGEILVWRSRSTGTGLESVRVLREITKREVDDYKVMVARKANRYAPSSLPRNDRIFIGKPKEIRGRSFLNVGSWSTEVEAQNCLRYLKSDFCNFLLGARLVATDVAPDRYSAIPLLDFSTGAILDRPGTFLDFSKPETLDDQLAEIYELTEEERELMRKNLKPWKDKVDVEADK